jgi:WD40 repeat protein
MRDTSDRRAPHAGCDSLTAAAALPVLLLVSACSAPSPSPSPVSATGALTSSGPDAPGSAVSPVAGSASASAHASAGPPITPPSPNIGTDAATGARTLILWTPDGRGFVAARGNRVTLHALPGGASTLVSATGDDVVALTVSPKGDRLATVSSSREVKIWHTKTGAAVATLPEGISEEVNDLAFSPDGKLFVGSGYSSARVWNVEQKTKVCDTGSSFAFGVAFTPDQGSVVTTGVGTMARFDARTCELKASNSAETGATFGSWVAPTGLHVVAAGGDGHKLQLYGGRDLHAIETLAVSAGCDDHVSGQFSRDGQVLLASGGSRWVRSFRLSSLKSIAAYDIPNPASVTFVKAFDDGERVLIGRGASAELVNARDKKVVYTFALEGAELFDLSWDMQRLLGVAGARVIVWDTVTGRRVESIEL